MTDTKLLLNTIVATTEEIEKELNPLGKGIFFAPESYIAFRLGISIYQNREQIFSTSNVKWIREKSFTKSAITDFAFEVGKEKFIFELKIRSTWHKYIADLQKLQSIDKASTKYFIALVDHLVNRPDGRINNVKSIFSGISNHIYYVLPTSHSPCSNPVNCEIHLFQLKSQI
jgi:hypothetical protein